MFTSAVRLNHRLPSVIIHPAFAFTIMPTTHIKHHEYVIRVTLATDEGVIDTLITGTPMTITFKDMGDTLTFKWTKVGPMEYRTQTRADPMYLKAAVRMHVRVAYELLAVL